MQEKDQHDRGQGDLLEGKMRIKVEGGYTEDPTTHKQFPIPKGSIITIGIQDVNHMPIFCMIRGTKDICINYINNKDYIIKFPPSYEAEIRQSFQEADSALIIYEPEKFINSLKNTINHIVVCDNIRYFDYDTMDINMLYFLLGENNFEKGKEYIMTYDNRYRHLLCKHMDFEEQREFRIIILDKKIEYPCSYSFKFCSEHKIVDLDTLFNGINVQL